MWPVYMFTFECKILEAFRRLNCIITKPQFVVLSSACSALGGCDNWSGSCSWAQVLNCTRLDFWLQPGGEEQKKNFHSLDIPPYHQKPLAVLLLRDKLNVFFTPQVALLSFSLFYAPTSSWKNVFASFFCCSFILQVLREHLLLFCERRKRNKK